MRKMLPPIIGVAVALALGLSVFQNCGRVQFQNPSGLDSLASSAGLNDHHAQIEVTPSKPNPPLDLFFVVDNSASMAGHQIDLGKNFASIFTNNASNLANFDTTVFVFSTTSTVNLNYLQALPSQAPATVSALPALNNVAALLTLPGGIFGLWQNTQGKYGQTGFSTQIFPSPTLGINSVSQKITPQLFASHIGSMSASDYAATAQTLTQDFQARLATINPQDYLNTSAQGTVETATDISSGLCTMARILHHAKDQALIKDGDAAAFILVSDDDDRLNVRNGQNNQCLETYANQASVVDGNCAQHQISFNYNAAATVSYKSNSTFSYESVAGTHIPYTFANGLEDCSIRYTTGTSYKYNYTYTQLKTAVTYQKCQQVADGVCLSPAASTVVVTGKFTGAAGQACAQADMSGINGISLPAPGTKYACVAQNQTQLTGSGTDSASDGNSCSAGIISQLSGDSTRADVVCSIVANSISPNVASKTITGRASGECAQYCSTNAANYPGCTLTGTSFERTSGNFNFSQSGISCASSCPDSSQCGNGTVAAGLSAKYGTSAVCGTPYRTLSNLTAQGVNTNDGTALTCASPIAGIHLNTSNGTQVCQALSASSTISDCVQSLQGNPSAASTCVSGSGVGSTTLVAAQSGIGCNTSCASSAGLCNSNQYPTVASYVSGALHGYCTASQDGGGKSFSVTLTESSVATAGCNMKCHDLRSGSCDGAGWGATTNDTVASYIAHLSPNATCSAGSAYPANQTNVAKATGVPAASAVGYCATNAEYPFFNAGYPYVATISTYTAGDQNHRVQDFYQYILAQAQTVFSAQNMPAMAVITQRPGDNLVGTDVGTSYINLVGPNYFGSNQVTSINGNYADSLAQISTFISKQAQNSFVLSLPDDAKILGVSMLTSGTTTWMPLTSSEWSFSGSTLSISSSVKLQIGDALQYEYTSAD